MVQDRRYATEAGCLYGVGRANQAKGHLMDEYDAVVVGGSVAGCTAATFLGRQGARVALLERSPKEDAYKVICTHAITA
jgi:NADPH-dependent 2,4-dienoyl-CoA reductase/sulfur reductase-like enzyme